MVSFTVMPPSRSGQFDLLFTHCHYFNTRTVHKQIQFYPAGLALLGLDHDGRVAMAEPRCHSTLVLPKLDIQMRAWYIPMSMPAG